jgi:hypothetical protein
MKGVLLWLVCWACRVSTRDFCSPLAALVGPVQNIFFLSQHNFYSFVSNAQQAGQAVVLGRLSLSMCLWFSPPSVAEIASSSRTEKYVQFVQLYLYIVQHQFCLSHPEFRIVSHRLLHDGA